MELHRRLDAIRAVLISEPCYINIIIDNKKVIDGSLVYLLRKIDNCITVCCDQKTAKNISGVIEKKRLKIKKR